MEPSIKYKGLLLSAAFIMCGCVVKGYQGKELPEDQLAMVQLKTPSIAVIPILDLLALGMDSDWHDTFFMDEIKVNNAELTRYNKVLLKPGNINFYGKSQRILEVEEVAGTRNTSYGTCSCTVTEDKDKKKQEPVKEQ